MPNHIIHTQKVVINIPDIDNAFRYQNMISEMFSNGLTTAIEDVLDAIDTPNTITRIQKLQLDLGAINPVHFADDFKKKLLLELRQSINTIHNKEVDVTIVKQTTSLKEAFIYFIEKGILPWHINVKDMPDFEAQIFNAWNNADWLFIINRLRKNAALHISKRLVLQFSDNFLKQFIAVSLNETIDDKQWQLLRSDIATVYNTFNEHEALGKQISKQCLFETFDLLFNTTKSYTLNVLIAEQLLLLIQRHFALNNNAFTMHYQTTANNIKTETITTVINNIYFIHQQKISLQNITAEELLDKNLAEKDWSTFKDVNSKNEINSGITTKDFSDVIHRQKRKVSKQQITDTEENIVYVDNCGVVLLHPFLLSYFEALLLIKDKKFISEEAHQRAVLLLYYLCTGLAEAAEFNLVLQKILCGYISEESLPASIKLTQLETDESAKLLQTVIGYWPPLKNTSIAGLQNTFLQRKGKLKATDVSWQLMVEQKTEDILLSKLPWGFSTVKLPWMNAVLSIEWC